MTFDLTSGFSPRGRAAVCSFCGRGPGKTQKNNPISQDRPVVSTDLDIEMEGVLEFCVDCAEEIGALVGMISKNTSAKKSAEIKALEASLADAETALEVAELAVDSLTAEIARRAD